MEQPRGANRARARYLRDDEIRAVLRALNTPELAGGYADCIRWLFWTALVPTVLGVLMGLAGLMGWYVHPDALAQLLS